MRRRTTLPLAVLLLAGTSGCAIFGAVLHKARGPEPVDAKYKPVQAPTLVLVENYHNPSINQIDSQRLMSRISAELGKHKVAPIIPPAEFYKARDAELSGFDKKTIPEIGKAVQASQVIYVNLIELTVEADESSQTYRSRGAANVRVVDTATGKTLWPSDLTAGYPVEYESPFQHAKPDITQQSVREPVYAALTDRISKLFYRWQPEG